MRMSPTFSASISGKSFVFALLCWLSLAFISTLGAQSGTIGDLVWSDDNQNGTHDIGEPGLPNVTVLLLNKDAQLIASRTSNELGFYLFDGLVPGQYLLQFILPGGYHFTREHQGTNDEIDSDANPLNGITPIITLGFDEATNFFDAGMVRRETSNLRIRKTVSKNIVLLNETYSYQISVTNSGPDPAYNVIVNEPLSTKLSLVQVLPPAQMTPLQLIWEYPILGVGETITFEITVYALEVGSAANIASVTSSNYDPHEYDNIASTLVDILLPVELVGFTASPTFAGVALSWSTASETENLGFYIERSQEANGPYERINNKLVPGAGSCSAKNNYTFMDRSAETGRDYYYRLIDVSFAGQMRQHSAVTITVPQYLGLSLPQNYPNPFNAETAIRFTLPQAALVRLSIYNLLGQKVKTLHDKYLNAGYHAIKWSGDDDAQQPLPSGLYLIHLESHGRSLSRSMHLLR